MRPPVSESTGFRLHIDESLVRRLERFLTVAVVVLVATHLLTLPVRLSDPPKFPAFFWSLWGLGHERTVGTWFATMQLASAAGVAALAAAVERRLEVREWRWWAFLAVLLLAASAEEILGFHEVLNSRLELPGVEARIGHTWVVPGAVVAGLLGALFARFVWTRPAPVRWCLLSGGALFVTGAVGFEVVGGSLMVAGHSRTVGSGVAVAEEGLELAGAALVLVAGVRQLALHCRDRGSSA